MSQKCTFCGKPQDEVKKLVIGPTANICNECIALCSDILSDGAPVEEEAPSKLRDLPRPAELKGVLDEYVIGQERAKRALCVAVYNHYKRLYRPPQPVGLGVDIGKSNVLFIGPTSRILLFASSTSLV